MGKADHQDQNRSVCSHHPDFEGKGISFTPLFDGKGAWRNHSLSAFTGRPILASEILGTVQQMCSQRRPVQTIQLRRELERFWRFLDRHDQDFPNRRVFCLSHVESRLGPLWVRYDAPSIETYSRVRRIIQSARASAGLSNISWPVNGHQIRGVIRDDVATSDQLRNVYRHLKKKWYGLLHRWEESDRLATQGRNLLGRKNLASLNVTRADLHTTYRHLVERTCNPGISNRELSVILGSCHPITQRFPLTKSSISELRAGLFLSKKELRDAFHLALIQLGWNIQTLLDIDLASGEWAMRIGGEQSNVVRISGFKYRGKALQRSLCLTTKDHSPFNILRALWLKAAPLRKGIADGHLQCEYPNIPKRSPWVFLLNNQVICLQREFPIAGFIREMNHENSARHDPPPPISEKIRASDFRHIFIGHAYAQSGFNAVIAKLAANHKNIRTTQIYLRKRSYRAHSENSVRTLLGHLWSEIENRKAVDPAILYALCQKGVITEEQRARWAQNKDRTYLGMGCLSPRNPPQAIDPTHKGNDYCHNQHLCTLCEHGMVFKDSVNFLARRLAEIQSIKEIISFTAWTEAKRLQREEAALKYTLEQFDPREVEERTVYWLNEINGGNHASLYLDGRHG